MPCDYSKYPQNWKSYIRPAILERAGDKCEWCGVMNKDEGYRDKSGEFVPILHRSSDTDAAEEIGAKVFVIILTVAHLDHDLSHNDGMDTGGAATDLGCANLVALCQKCHNNHDAPHRAETRRRKSKQMELF